MPRQQHAVRSGDCGIFIPSLQEGRTDAAGVSWPPLPHCITLQWRQSPDRRGNVSRQRSRRCGSPKDPHGCAAACPVPVRNISWAAGLLHYTLVVHDYSQVSARFLLPPGLLHPRYCPCTPSVLEQESKPDSNRSYRYSFESLALFFTFPLLVFGAVTAELLCEWEIKGNLVEAENQDMLSACSIRRA